MSKQYNQEYASLMTSDRVAHRLFNHRHMDLWMTLIHGTDRCRAANAPGIQAGLITILRQILQILQAELTID